MDLTKPPDWLVNLAPAGGARDFVQGAGWYVILGIGGLIVLLLLWTIVRALLPRGKKAAGGSRSLEENLEQYPAPPPRTGHRRLLVDGVPVRLRLVVIAPTGSDSDEALDLDQLDALLERVLPGLGEIYKVDKPRVKRWKRQLSYQGFATHFFGNMLTGAAEGELSPWVLVAGRVKLKGMQLMLGLALLALKPTTVGERTVDAHEWESTLRVRMRD
jgi:hypothetical protein